MKVAEIRRTYLKFFEERGHSPHPSASLVPDDDPSLLFTGAGMNQFKDMFLGRGSLPFKRATTSQKCLRVPDLDEVGRTPSHHTFFEMLGNFSFGDYFKTEAIAWADELLREGFGLDRSRLAISIFEDDDEAFECWRKIGYSADRIFRYGEKDNFWPAEAPSKGPNGPCGPCSEIYYDFGESVGGVADPSENGQRFVEIWNLVFTQFNRQDGGELPPLPQRNIDTGMGLERLARVLQGVGTNFETDAFRPTLDWLCEKTGCAYGEDARRDRAMRRIADHVRAAVFCVADGVVPSNERQGYVVRKILRRAVADGMDALGFEDPFVGQLLDPVLAVEGLVDVYPDLTRLRDKIHSVLDEEEEKFRATFQRGKSLLEEEIEKLPKGAEFPGKVAFFLWDTVGFPLDLTRRVLEDRGLGLEEEGFDRAMENQRSQARAATNLQAEIFDSGPLAELKKELGPTVFDGYSHSSVEQPIRALLKSGELADQASEGDEVVLIFDRTPFYAEGGGQVGDKGTFESASGKVRIHDTQQRNDFHLHLGAVVSGSIGQGDSGTLCVDASHRLPTMRNHTATHLVHWALRRVLGKSVEQKGSLVEAERLRFDFSFPTAVAPEQLQEVERLVNEQVLKNIEVSKEESSFDAAVKAGAMALFGEKYGDEVRVVKVLDQEPDRSSVELCGGTHVTRTGDIGAFKITSESGIAAGVRRIEAVTGMGSVHHLQDQEGRLLEVAAVLKCNPKELAPRVQGLQDEIRRLRKELDQSNRSQGTGALEEILALKESVGELQLFIADRELGSAQLSGIGDSLRDRVEGAFCAVLIGRDDGGKVPVLVWASKAAQSSGINAGAVCRRVAGVLGGGGGGNPGFARGQGRKADSVEAALAAAREEISGQLS